VWTPAAVGGGFLPSPDFPFQPFRVSEFQLFASWPVEQRPLGLLLGPTYGLLRIFDGFALLQTVPLADLRRSRHPKLLSFVAKRLPGWQESLGTRGIS
jgi:hypothetical protein